MSDIQTYLDEIRTALYGEEVRSSIINAINQCYQDAAEGVAPEIEFETLENGTKIKVTVGGEVSTFTVNNGTDTVLVTKQVTSSAINCAAGDEGYIDIPVTFPGNDYKFVCVARTWANNGTLYTNSNTTELTNGGNVRVYWSNWSSTSMVVTLTVSVLFSYNIMPEASVDITEPTYLDYQNNELLLSKKDVTVDKQYYHTIVRDGALKKVYNPANSTFFGVGANDVCAALTIADDYLKNWDQFYYDMSIGGKGGFVYNGTYDNPEEDTPVVNGSGQKAMNCAIFTNLVLQGVPYTYSTYSKTASGYKNLATNPVFAPKSKNALAYGLENQYTYPNLAHSGLYTWKLARYLYDMGVLRPVGDNMSATTGLGYQAEGTYNPGDILFFAQEDSKDDYFMGIRHCALMAGYIGYSTLKRNTLIIECSSPTSGSNISALKVRTLRDSDHIVAAFTPGYNNGFNLMAQPTVNFDENSQGYTTNLVVTKSNIACNGSANAVNVNSLFSGVFSNIKQYRGACMLVVDPIYTSNIATVKWVLTYHNTLDSWSDTILNGSGEHAMTGVGKFVIPIPYGTTVSLYTDSSYVSAANFKLNIVTSDKFLEV